MNTAHPRFLFADGKSANIAEMLATVDLVALAANEPATQLRRFKMDAYNGGAMRFFWSDVPVVVDLAGMDLGDKARPIFKDHSPSLIVGHTSKITKSAKTLAVEGVVSGAGAVAREVVDAADKGFPWQASIGAEILRDPEQIRAGDSVTVNGQKFTGPIAIVRWSRLAEVSFVALGADDTTAARMAAGKSIHPHIGNNVKKSITLSALLVLAAAYPHLTAALHERAEVADKESDDTKKGETDLKAWAESQPKPTKVEATDGDESDRVDALKAARVAAAAETRRIGAIRKVCAGRHADIEAEAIESGISAEAAELKVLRAERQSAPAIGGRASANVATADVLEAALLQATRQPEESFKGIDERVQAAAHKRYRGRIGLQEMLLEAALAHGYQGGTSVKSDLRGVLSAAFDLQASGFSRLDVGTLFTNTANKILLGGFNAVDQSWRQLVRSVPVTDFKSTTLYRVSGDFVYEEVAPGGELKHAKLSADNFSAQAKTYGKIVGLTRQDIINDDLNALNEIPRQLGRGGALKLGEVFWTAFLNNSAIFTAGNNNYISGATTVLSIDSLSAAVEKFRMQTDAQGKPLGVEPRYLVVPPALEAVALQIVASLELRDTTASTKYGTTNPHRGKYEVVVSPYLQNSLFTGYSATAWYLLADPADMGVIGAVFLNGVESPTIESSDADFEQLGVLFRGYHDFGVSSLDYRAGVKSKGAA